MGTMPMTILVVLAVVACSREQPSSAGAGQSAASSAASTCRTLDANDIGTVTGVEVHAIARGAAVGAGGTCANFASTDGEAYLGVNRSEGASAYPLAVGRVPQGIYTVRRALPGVGDESTLMSDDRRMIRYLVAREGQRVVELFPMGQGTQMSDRQLGELARRALARN